MTITEEDMVLIKDAKSILSRLMDKTKVGRAIKPFLKKVIEYLAYLIRKGIKAIETASKIAGKVAVAFDIDDQGIPAIVEEVSGKVIKVLE